MLLRASNLSKSEELIPYRNQIVDLKPLAVALAIPEKLMAMAENSKTSFFTICETEQSAFANQNCCVHKLNRSNIALQHEAYELSIRQSSLLHHYASAPTSAKSEVTFRNGANWRKMQSVGKTYILDRIRSQQTPIFQANDGRFQKPAEATGIDGFSTLLQRIPRKFVSHFKEKLLSTVRLIGPSRNVWIVKTARTDDDVVFQIGWEKFVLEHSLAERDFLVFHYIGYSSFNVSIFDETGCEREGAFFVNKHISCTRNACLLQNEEEKILQIDVEEMEGKVKKEKLKGRDGAIGEVRERNMKCKTSMLGGTSFEANNSNIETFGARKEHRPKRKK